MKYKEPLPADGQRMDNCVRTVNCLLHGGEGYSWYRYAEYLLTFRRHLGADILFPPFPGMESLDDTLAVLPDKLIAYTCETIVREQETRYDGSLAMGWYRQCLDLLQELTPGASSCLLPFQEIMAEHYFGRYGRDGLPRFS